VRTSTLWGVTGLGVIGASALNAEGPSDMISGAAAVKRAMMRRSLSTMLVVTNDKFGRSGLERVCALSEISDVVTDSEPEAELRAAIEEAGGDLHVVAES